VKTNKCHEALLILSETMAGPVRAIRFKRLPQSEHGVSPVEAYFFENVAFEKLLKTSYFVFLVLFLVQYYCTLFSHWAPKRLIWIYQCP